MKVDYTGLLHPVPEWKKEHEAAAESYPAELRGKYLNSINKLLESYSNKKGPSLDLNKMGAADWPNLDLVDSHTVDLNTYKPNEYESCISEHYSRVWGIGALPAEEGFYRTAPGRKAYHGMLTTCLGNTLLGLLLVSARREEVSGLVEEGSDIFDLLQFVAGSLRNLFYLVDFSPLLGTHLRWLLAMSSLTASQNHTPVPNAGLIHGQSGRGRKKSRQGSSKPAAAEHSQIRKGKKRSANQLDTHEESRSHSEEGKMCEATDENLSSDIVEDSTDIGHEMDQSLPDRDGVVTSILRWLRLITLHTCSIEKLAFTSTCDKLSNLDVKLLKVTLPPAYTDIVGF